MLILLHCDGNKTMWVIPKGLSFPTLNSILFQNSRCIVFLWVHRTQPYPYLPKLIKFLATLKLIQLLRKFVWRYLWVTVVNTVSLKEIEWIVFKKQTSEICGNFFLWTCTVKIKLHLHVKMKLHLQEESSQSKCKQKHMSDVQNVWKCKELSFSLKLIHLSICFYCFYKISTIAHNSYTMEALMTK